MDRLTHAKDGHGNTVSYEYNLANQQIGITYPNGKAIARTFDKAGRLKSITDWLGNMTSFAYNRNSDLATTTYPSVTGNTDVYGYDRADAMIEITMKKGSEVLTSLSYGRDKLGQVETVTSKGLPGPETQSLAYDLNDRLAKAGSEAFEYDAADNLTKASGSTFSYDAANQLEQGVGVTFSYDKEGERTKETPSRLPVYSSQFGSSGTGNGQFSGPTGIAVGPNGHIWVADTGNNRIQHFDSEGKFVSQFGATGSGNGQFKKPYGLAVSSEERIWVTDKENNRVQQFNAEGKYLSQIGTLGSGTGQFSSPSGLAVGSSGHIWVADTGNKRVQEFNKAGEYVTKFGEAGSGLGQFNNPVGVVNSIESKAWVTDSTNNKVQGWALVEHPTTYKYDQAGNLTAVERPKAGEIPAINESYGYDGAGLRTSQTIAGETSYLAWDRSISLPLLLSDGSTSYIYGPGGLPIEQISSAGTPTFYHHDQLGSTRMLTDGSGKVTGTFSYGAFGAPSGTSGTQKTPLGFAGQYTAVQSGLQYLRARAYDPTTGQFLSRDPIEALTRQPYAYAFDNPLNLTDPSGQVGEAVAACGLTWEVPGVGEASCGMGAAEVAAGLAALAGLSLFSDTVDGADETHLTLSKEDQEYEEEHHECPLSPPARPYRGANAPDQWWDEQGRPRGISRGQVRERLHDSKEGAGLSADDDVVIGRTGDVYDPKTGERIGSLTQPVN